jgi:hypothetical protein
MIPPRDDAPGHERRTLTKRCCAACLLTPSVLPISAQLQPGPCRPYEVVDELVRATAHAFGELDRRGQPLERVRVRTL